MARRPGAPRRWAGGRLRGLVIAGLALFVIVDVVLVLAAVRSTSTDDPGKLGPIPTYTSTPEPEPTSTTGAGHPGPSATSDPSSLDTSSDPQNAAPLLSAVSATDAWRATPGACGGTTTTVERTTDAGATWKAVDLGDSSVEQVVSLDAGSSVTSIAGGSGNSCALDYVSSFTDGSFWKSYPEKLAQASYIDPDDSKLHLGADTEAAPCDTPVHVVTSGTTTAVQCDGSVSLRTGTAAWSTKAVAGLAAIGAGKSGILLAVTGSTDCSGIAVETLAAGADPTPLGCAEPSTDVSGVTPTTTAITSTGDSVWLWTGDTVLVSSDGGVQW